jgi:hypothetical protein
MPESPTNPDRPSQAARPWYRLHLSTCVVLVALGGFFVVLILPGESYESGNAYLSDWGSTDEFVLPFGTDRLEHGWPLVFARGPTDVASDPRRIPWTKLGRWRLCDHITEFQSVNLTIDICVAILLLALAAAAFEWRRRRRHNVWQFTIREMGALFVVVAGCLAWLRMHQLRFQQESEVLARMEHSVDSRSSRSDSTNAPFVFYVLRYYSTAYCGPRWLRKVVPPKCLEVFQTPAMMQLCVEPAPHRSSAALERLCEDLKCFPNLRQVHLNFYGDAKATDVWLLYLSRLTALESLYLPGGPIGDAGVKHLEGLTGLKRLSLDDTQVTDDGLESVAALEALQELGLARTRVSDAGLLHVRQLRNLEYLDLTETLVTDEGLEHLHALGNLDMLNLWQTRVTDKGIERLKRALPRCEIAY